MALCLLLAFFLVNAVPLEAVPLEGRGGHLTGRVLGETGRVCRDQSF